VWETEEVGSLITLTIYLIHINNFSNLTLDYDTKFIWAQRLVSLPVFMVAEQATNIHGNYNDGYGGKEELGGP